MTEEEIKQLDEDDGQVRAKQSYVSPRLVVHGDIEKITRGDEGGEQDQDLGGTSVGGDIG